ncbi:hypothetical protein EGW08_012621 [Elysia chlorotica]|uniref:Uncharacterized protein n=1 Tax=Elysia chlorotica TaxID=188477 RepID=A0A433TDC6_ELYCH|nr:hypothetical protein EGW08_012621 [Elysia chlorotica]
MQALLDEVRRLQLSEHAQLAERGRQLRQQQDLLLTQQAASLRKQQKQLMEFQKQLEEQQNLYRNSILSGSTSDLLRSIIRDEVKDQARVNGKRTNMPATGGSLDKTNTGLGFPASNNIPNRASDLLGLGAIEAARKPFGRGNNNNEAMVGLPNGARKRNSLGRTNDGIRGRDASGTSMASSTSESSWGSPLSPLSSSSSSSASSISSSRNSRYSPMYSSSASSSASSPSSFRASNIPFPSPAVASSRSRSEAQGAGGVAKSWSVAWQSGIGASGAPSWRLPNPRSNYNSRPNSGTSVYNPRLTGRDVALEKTRTFYNKRGEISIPRPSSSSNNNNPLGLRLDTQVGNNKIPQNGPTLDGTSYSTFPFTLPTRRLPFLRAAGRESGTGASTNSFAPTRQSPQTSVSNSNGVQSSSAAGQADPMLSARYRSRAAPSTRNSTTSRGIEASGDSFVSGGRFSLHNQRQQQRQSQHQQPHYRYQQQNQHHHQINSRQQRPQQQHQLPGSEQRQLLPGQTRQLQRQATQVSEADLAGAQLDQAVPEIEVRATPARRLTPGGPLRIGLDINVRHGVYPIEELKQPSV